MRPVIAFPIIVLLAVVGGCTPNTGQAEGQDADGKVGEEKADIPAPLVEVIRPRLGSIRDTLTLSGDLKALHTVNVTSHVGGLVEEVSFREGDIVNAGQVLIRLDKSELVLSVRREELAYDDAVARSRSSTIELRESRETEALRSITLAKSKREYDRFREVADVEGSRAFPKEEFESRKYSYDQAKIEFDKSVLAQERAEIQKDLAEIAARRARVAWDQALLKLARCEIKSPIDGALSFIELREGEWVQDGAHVASVINRERLYTEVGVPQRMLPTLKIGQRVEVSSEVSPSHSFVGTLEMIHPTVDPKEGTAKVRVSIQDPEEILRPGMYVTTTIVTATFEQALLLSKKARLFERDRSIVYVVREGKSVRMELQIGLQTVEEMQVLSARIDRDGFESSPTELRATDRIVVRGQSSLEDDVAVRIHGEEDVTDSGTEEGK